MGSSSADPTTTTAVTAPASVALKIGAAGVAFAYFHPLAQPHIEPAANSIVHQRPFSVSAEAVLRFGMLEGSAIVDADSVKVALPVYGLQEVHHLS